MKFILRRKNAVLWDTKDNEGKINSLLQYPSREVTLFQGGNNMPPNPFSVTFYPQIPRNSPQHLFYRSLRTTPDGQMQPLEGTANPKLERRVSQPRFPQHASIKACNCCKRLRGWPPCCCLLAILIKIRMQQIPLGILQPWIDARLGRREAWEGCRR